MYELQALNFGDDITLDSRIVAEMLDKKHSDLLRDIETYIQYFSENADLRSQDFFVKSSYKVNGNNKSYKSYQITKRGCEFLAHKLTGQKGTVFTAKYINAFNELKESASIQNNDIIQMLVMSQKNIVEMVAALSKTVDMLGKNLTDDKSVKAVPKPISKPKKNRLLLIQTLPGSTIKLVDTMLTSGTYTYADISNILKNMGYNIGKYAVARYNKKVLKGAMQDVQ